MDNLANTPVTQVFNKAGLSAGSTTTYSTTAAPLNYSIASKLYSKAAVTSGATPTVDLVDGLAFQPLAFPANATVGGQGSVFVFAFNAGATIGVAQGSVEQLDVTGNFVIAPQFPTIPDTYAPFAYLLVRLGPTAVANWTFGTNNLSGVTGVTYTFVDISMIPARPQIA